MTTMPDPWGPPSIVDLNVHEAPIREVLSRLCGLISQLNDYAQTAIEEGATSTETRRAQSAIAYLVGAADNALLAWDRWLAVEQAPESEGPTYDELGDSYRPAAAQDRVVDLMEALEHSISRAKAARERALRRTERALRRTGLTPDQEAAAAEHRRLQGR